MKEILKITASLTGVCVAAALLLGAVFAKTEHARKASEERIKQETVQDLLGFGAGNIPADLKIYKIHRYVVKETDGKVLLGYVVPLKEKGFGLVEVDLSGKAVKTIPIQAEAAQLADKSGTDAVLKQALPKGTEATYAETLYVADRGGKRLGYVVPGVTQGFKNFVRLMVSLNPEFVVTGVAITESEEDPGLGDKIKDDFFKNQFVGKTLDLLKELKVVKEPLPGDYLPALDPAVAKKDRLSPEKISEIRAKHVKDDIYAITGATISSRALTTGVQETVRKFVYRLGILDAALKQENVAAAF
ncbi:MAG: FMN-binding protein [Desulfomonile tiedjei]|nr:FMN-binding protein [Desulfomonile tiedjei]